MKTKAFCGRGAVPILRQWWRVSVQPELDFSPGFSVMQRSSLERRICAETAVFGGLGLTSDPFP